MIETVKKPRKILMVIVIGSILVPPALEVRAGLQWPICVNDVSVADVEFQETIRLATGRYRGPFVPLPAPHLHSSSVAVTVSRSARAGE